MQPYEEEYRAAAPGQQGLAVVQDSAAGHWDEHPLCEPIDEVAAGSYFKRESTQFEGTGSSRMSSSRIRTSCSGGPDYGIVRPEAIEHSAQGQGGIWT